jgi:phenylalanyl-tRNA synthetase alpha subunit
MIAKGTWENAEFKELNFKAMGKEICTGNLHPLLKVR